jgi:heme-degrading monooxygenase HmoA
LRERPTKEVDLKGRIVFQLHLKPGHEQNFLDAYEATRHEVAQGVPGHIMDQVCQSLDDPQGWLITSEWEDIESFLAWERTEEHRELAKPMRDCWDEAKSFKYVVKMETGHPETAAAPSND